VLVTFEFTPHTYIPFRETLYYPSLLLALHRHGHPESWLRLYRSASLKWFQFKSAQSWRVRFFAFIHRGACVPGSLRLYVDSNRKQWTFGSGSLLCQRFRRRRKEMAWKRRRIETNLVIVIVMLRVLTYIVSYKLFGNWCWCCAICISRGLIWQRVCHLTLSSVLFGTNCVIVITEYCGSNYFHH